MMYEGAVFEPEAQPTIIGLKTVAFSSKYTYCFVINYTKCFKFTEKLDSPKNVFFWIHNLHVSYH